MKRIHRRLNPIHHAATWLAVASFLSGMTEAWAELPEEKAVSGAAVASETRGWVCSVDLLEERVEAERVYMGWVEYGNLGAEPIDAPYVHLDAGDGTGIKFTATDPWSGKLEFLATSAEAPASRLKPGEVRRLPFFYRTAGTAATIRFGYTMEDSSEFNWAASAALMRPSWVADAAWTPAMVLLRAKMGRTWNDILSQLRADADHLAEVGDPVRRVDRLWRLELEEALGVDHAVPTLADTIDLARAARAFPLGFARTYGTSLPSRARESILGPGWSDNFDVRASLGEDGNVLSIWAGSAMEYRFHRTEAGWVPESEADPTVIRETDGEYLLSLENGPELVIGKPSGRLLRMADGQGNHVDFVYDAEGRLVRAVHVDGPSLAFAYRADGRLASVADDLGRVCRYGYEDGRLAIVKGADGLVTRYRYWPADGTPAAGSLRQVVSPDGSTLDFAWDGQGRLATVAVNGDSLVTEIRRGTLGSYGIIEPNGAETRFTLGSLGQPLSATDALGHKITLTYQAGDVVNAVTGPTGKRASLGYDQQGRLSRIRTPGGGGVQVGYDGDGRVASLTDPRGNAYEFGYDALGRDLSVSFAGGPALRVEYDGRGDLSRAVNRRGQGIDLGYDAKGRPVSATWENGRSFRVVYDDRDNPVRAEDSETGAVTIEYDVQDRPVKVVYPGNRGYAYAYDAVGRVMKKSALDGSDVRRYEYDGVGRMVRMTDGERNLLLENVFEPKTGELLRQRYGNGTESVYRHDLLGRETRIEHRVSSGETIAAFDYTYDDDGRVATQTTPEGTERYGYDADGQLVSVEYPDGSRETFEYDAAGNRTARTRTGEGRTEYEINEFNQVVSATAPDGRITRYEYDADGNLVRKTAPGVPAMVYAYDVQNRLVSVREESAGGLDWSCAYDVFGNRVRVTENGQITERLYSLDGLPSVAAEYQDGVLVRRHVLAGGIVLADVDADGTQRWLHADAVAAVRAVTDEDGRPVAHADYRAFGEIRSGNTAAGTGTWGWSGMLGIESDPSGLLFMRNRTYDPDLGRFVQQDPLGLNGGQLNLYLYCGNNPVNDVDPLGLFDWSWSGIKKGVSDWWAGLTWCKVLAGVHWLADKVGFACAVIGIAALVVAGIAAAIATAPGWLTALAGGLATAAGTALVVGLGAALTKLITTIWAKVIGARISWKEMIWEGVEVALSAIAVTLKYVGQFASRLLQKLLSDAGHITQKTFPAALQWLKDQKWVKGLDWARQWIVKVFEKAPKKGQEWLAFKATVQKVLETLVKVGKYAGTVPDVVTVSKPLVKKIYDLLKSMTEAVGEGPDSLGKELSESGMNPGYFALSPG